ncbi:amidohydrolase family protein [Mucilaginibacter gynuensis]|uniref:Amidohydrolase family protein n=1 Tax=Mucilaginibacter gynuensis TaxID=1302236 RepID=A0ABP8FMA9_9SPHI
MLKIDSHQHFWIYDPVKDAWITDDMSVIQRDFLPDNLAPLLQYNHISGCVAIQADQSDKESDFLLGLAKDSHIIRGVVGWVDFQADDIESRLEHYSRFPKLKGFRHVLQAEPDVRFMLGAKFMHGISLLKKYDFTYDILIKPQHLQAAAEFVAAFPEQRFVIDHLAKPLIKDGLIDEWQEGIGRLAKFPNVYCKVSGFVTEADWHSWQAADFIPYFDIVFNSFGLKRVMFGSDWPVNVLAGGYNRALKVLTDYTAKFTETEQAQFWGQNAMDFYRL